MPDVFAVIVAGGKGRRMGASLSKQYLDLGGFPILYRTLDVFVRHPEINCIYLVVPVSDFDFCKKNVIGPLPGNDCKIELVAGGKTRFASVENGLAAVAFEAGIVVVHDGVRPFLSPDIISAVIAGAASNSACIAAVPVVDTIKSVEKGRITATLDRKGIWMAQTPQAFDLNLLRAAYAQARKEAFEGTDDASVFEHYGRQVSIVAGRRLNFKITTPDDLELARMIWKGLS